MINVGILGIGNISTRFAQSLTHLDDVNLYGVAARNQEKAQTFKKTYEYEVYYNKFEDLINDHNVDFIYIGLPHDLHYKWSRYALSKGVAVLCEKPATLNSTEMLKLADFAKFNNVLFMEAMKNRFTPTYKHMKYLIDSNYIGNIQKVKLSHCFDGDFTKFTYHLKPEVGGCILDVSCYTFSLITDIIKGDISDIKVEKKYEADVEVDVIASFKICGTLIEFENSFIRDTENKAQITGETGEITLFNLHRSESMLVIKNSETTKIDIPYVYDDFFGEVKHFVDLIKNEKTESDIMSLEDSISISSLVDTFKNF